MARSESVDKNRVRQYLILAFVIITMSLLVVQLGLNTLDTIEQSANAEVTATPLNTRTPPPTYDPSDAEEINDA